MLSNPFEIIVHLLNESFSKTNCGNLIEIIVFKFESFRLLENAEKIYKKTFSIQFRMNVLERLFLAKKNTLIRKFSFIYIHYKEGPYNFYTIIFISVI